MGLFKKFVSQTRKPEGFLGRLMISSMNGGHARLADWGMSNLKGIEPERIAELGCGGGRNAEELLKRYPKAMLTALDYSELSVSKTKEINRDQIAAGRCRVLQGNVADLPFEAESFDLATAFETVYFWPGLEACFAEVFRVLSPDGVFLICNESDGTDAAGLQFEKIIEGMKCHTQEQLESALKKAGFTTVRTVHHPSRPWITVLAGKGRGLPAEDTDLNDTEKRKMSAKYRVLKALVKASGLKKRWKGSADDLLENRRKANAKNRIPVLHDPEMEIRRITVCGCPVITMKHGNHGSRANLSIIGGGMISAPRPDSLKKALRFAKETGLDVYVPYYPLCTDYPLTKAYDMIHATYREMLKTYDPDRISVLGTSSGGNLALGMVPYINENAPDTPMPGYIMTISPGTCAASEAEWQRMLELEKKDVAIPAAYMKTAEKIMRHGDDSVPDYMIWLQKGNFANCPFVTFIYGSDETLFACAPSFEAAMKKYGAEYELIVGEGMFHCYPVFPVCREAKDGWDMMIRKVKEHTGA